MVITHHGADFFKVSFGDTTLAFSPIGKDSKLKPTRFGADIACISLEHPDCNGADQLSHGDHEPLVIRGPGEYEARNIIIKGYPTTSTYGGTELINTAYLVTMDKMLLLYLGATNSKELPHELKEALDKIDILFIPIGDQGVLGAADAYELAVSVEPKVIIPMHYGDIGKKDALATFLKEEGETDNHKPVDKLTVKTRDLDGMQNQIVVFT